jgi:hypothetical protein
LSIRFELDPPLLERKFSAIATQVSQSEAMIETLGREFFDATQRGEYFKQAARKEDATS